MVERSRFGDQAERRKNAAVTTRVADPGRTLAVAAAGTLLTLVAFANPLTTLTGTAADLTAGPGAQAWILSGMSLGAAAGLLSSGAIGDDYGRRRTFLAGTLVLAASSLLGALAPDALMLIVARILQGLGGRRCSPAASALSGTRSRPVRPGHGRPVSGAPRSAPGSRQRSLAVATTASPSVETNYTEEPTMRIRLGIGDAAATATLRANETARDLAALLPLTLSMNDLFGREKYGHLPRAISEGGGHQFAYEIGNVAY